MNFQKFPNAPGDKACAVKGDVWNRLSQTVTDFSRLTVAPPLMLSMTPAGPPPTMQQVVFEVEDTAISPGYSDEM